MTTSDTGPQPTAQMRLCLPDWHLGEHLLPLEEDMRAKAANGELVDGGKGPFNLAAMQAWTGDRAVRASVLRYMLVSSEWPVAAKGVRLRGVRIKGHLDLEGATLRCPLSLESCYIDSDELVSLDHATAFHVAMTKCQLPGLTGEMLTTSDLDLTGSTLNGPLLLPLADIKGQLNCRDAFLHTSEPVGNAMVADLIKVGGGIILRQFTATGAIRLLGADITGQFSCSGAELAGTDGNGNALVADLLTSDGGVLLDNGFTAAGAIRLLRADITGQFSCSGAELTGTDGDGNVLFADGMRAVGSVILKGEFTGAIRLLGADITGQLSCRGAHLTRTDHEGDVLIGDGMKVGEGIFLDEGFTAAGAVRLRGADITGTITGSGAQLTGTNRDGDTLVADGIKVGGSVFLDRRFTAAGKVSLSSARIGRSLSLMPASLAEQDAVDAAGAQISGRLKWMPDEQISGQVNLQGATAAELEDDWVCRSHGYWPTGGRLSLDGFTYGRFSGDHQATLDQRLAWIRSQCQSHVGDGQTDFATQPYEQLATVYRQAGQDAHARKIAIARRADLRRYGDLSPYRKAVNWFLDKTIKYGYQSWRAAVGLAIVFVAFLMLSWWGQHHHMIVPVGKNMIVSAGKNVEGLNQVPSATQCTSRYPCFYPAGYAVDTVIPIIKVGQAQYWRPNGSAQWGWAFVISTWIATGLGWALVTLLVTGYTGLVRKE